MQRWKLAAVAAVLGVALLAGCSKSDSASSSASSDFCNKARQAEQSFAALQNVDPSNTAALDQAVQQMNSLAASAPQEIKADLQTVATTTQQLLEAVKNADPNNPEALFEAFGSVDMTSVQTASTNVDNYLKNTCGMTGSGGATTTAS